MKPAEVPVRYPALDGVRGVAILLVLLNHNLLWIPFFAKYFYVGVDLFFVLSGFLITEILIRNAGKPHYFHNFYIKRIFRILPVYFLVFLLFLSVISLIPDLSKQFEYYTHNILFYVFYAQNWAAIFKPIGINNAIFSHFWSLGIEEQFYLIFPLVVLVLRRGKKLFLFLVGFLILLLIYRFIADTFIPPGDQKFNAAFMTRFDGICAGALIAVAKNHTDQSLQKWLTKIFLGFLSAYFLFTLFMKVFFHNSGMFYVFGYTALAFGFGLIVRSALKEDSFFYRILNIRFLKFFGLISYGLYLIHYPVSVLGKRFVTVRFHWIDVEFNDTLRATVFSFLMILISTGLAYLSFRYFENPVLKKRKLFLK